MHQLRWNFSARSGPTWEAQYFDGVDDSGTFRANISLRPDATDTNEVSVEADFSLLPPGAAEELTDQFHTWHLSQKPFSHLDPDVISAQKDDLKFIEFTSKRITNHDIRAFAEELASMAKPMLYHKTVFTVYGQGIELSSSTTDIFAKAGILDTHIIRRVTMEAVSGDRSKKIFIEFAHTTESLSSNRFQVTNTDREKEPKWTTNKYERLKIVFDNVKNQKNDTGLIRVASCLLSAILGAFLFYMVRELAAEAFLSSEVQESLCIFISFLTSILYATHLWELSDGMYPFVELQTGPQELQVARSKRVSVRLRIFVLLLAILAFGAIIFVLL